MSGVAGDGTHPRLNLQEDRNTSTRQQRRRKPNAASPTGKPRSARARRAAQAKATPWYLKPWALGAVVAIVAIVVVLFVVKGNNTPASKTTGFGAPPASVLNALTQPPGRHVCFRFYRWDDQPVDALARSHRSEHVAPAASLLRGRVLPVLRVRALECDKRIEPIWHVL